MALALNPRPSCIDRTSPSSISPSTSGAYRHGRPTRTGEGEGDMEEKAGVAWVTSLSVIVLRILSDLLNLEEQRRGADDSCQFKVLVTKIYVGKRHLFRLLMRETCLAWWYYEKT